VPDILISCKKDEQDLPPSIESFSPTSGSAGMVVNITGKNFNPITDNNIVKFNETPAIVTSATLESITVTVPSGASTGKISVTSQGMTATSDADFIIFNSPEITSVSPSSGLPGESIAITGKNFSTTPTDNTIKFNGLAATVTASSSTSLTVTVPAEATTGKITVSVHDMTTTSSFDFVVPPIITSFSPTSGETGTSVTITGTGFNSEITKNIVKFNNKIATVTAASATSLTVTVPDEASTGKITLTVSDITETSATDFIVVPKITNFSPGVGAIGATVIISGTGFNTTISSNTIKFNGTIASCIAATNTSLTVLVPDDATSGKITVEVGGNIATSNTDFEVVVEVAKAGGTDYDQGFSVAVDGSGNTFVAGRFSGTANFGNTSLISNGNVDIFLAKYNSSCDLVWAKKYGGSGSDNCQSISVDAAGNIYATGTFNGTVSFGTTTLVSASGSSDIFVAKFNASGDAVWADQIGSGSSNVESGNCIKVDASGNLYLTGKFFGTVTVGATTLVSTDGGDILVAKYNSTTGNVIWAKGFGGSDDDSGIAIAYNSSGDVYVSGSFFGTASFETINLISDGGLDAFLAKLNSAGDVVWAKQISGSNWENVYSLAIDANSNCYISGYISGTTTLGTTTINSAGNEDIFLAKFNAAGGVSWAKSAGGTDYDQAHSVAVDAVGNAYVTGYFTRTATFGDKSLTSDNNSRDIFVTKFNSAGDVLWAKQAGGADDDYGKSVSLDASGTIYITGSFRGTVTFGSTTLLSSGNDDIYLWKIWQ